MQNNLFITITNIFAIASHYFKKYIFFSFTYPLLLNIRVKTLLSETVSYFHRQAFTKTCDFLHPSLKKVITYNHHTYEKTYTSPFSARDFSPTFVYFPFGEKPLWSWHPNLGQTDYQTFIAQSYNYGIQESYLSLHCV